MPFELFTDGRGNGRGLARFGFEEHFDQIVGRVEFTGVRMAHAHRQGDTFAPDTTDPAFDGNEISGLQLFDEARRCTGADRMHAMRLLQRLQAHAGHGVEMKSRVVEEVGVPAHVHMAELVVVPGVHDPA